jgi:hypothetical protein
MLLEALSIGGSLVSGLIQSGSANKAAKKQEAMQREAIAAQQQAAESARRVYDPTVQQYNRGLGALGDRIGVPSAGDQTANGVDVNAYIQSNPDVAAARQSLEAQGVIGAGKQWDTFEDWVAEVQLPGAMSSGEQRAYPTAQAAPQSSTNALTGNPGTFGNTADPTWTAPDPFSFDINSFVDNPAYRFAQEQGSGQVMANSAATGALQSGAALKALQDRGQKTAYGFFDQERDAAYGQWLDKYKIDRANYESDRSYLTGRYDSGVDDLYNFTGLGQNALTGTANAYLGEGSATARGLNDIGDTQAGNALAQGSIWSNTVNNALGGVTGLLKNQKPKTNSNEWSPTWGGGS